MLYAHVFGMLTTTWLMLQHIFSKAKKMTYFTETLKVTNILVYQLAILYMQLKIEDDHVGNLPQDQCIRINCSIK